MAESAAVTVPEGIWQVTTNVTPDPRVVTLHAMEHGLSEGAALRALTSGTGTSVVIATPDWEPNYVESKVTNAGRCARLDNLPRVPPYCDERWNERWNECWLIGWDTADREELSVVRHEPEILVTVEMVELTDPDWEPDYVIISRLRENERQCIARIATLETENAALLAQKGGTRPFSGTVASRMAVDPEFCAALEEEDTQSLVSFGKKILSQRVEIAALQSDKAALLATIEMLDKRLGVAAFGAASDIPDPPRRPDGTLAPQGKPWAPPKTSDQRRIGS